MSIVSESNVPNLVLQLNVVQKQIYYRGMYKDIPDNHWKDEIGPKLYPLWDTDKDKLIVFSFYDNNTYHAQRRKFIKNFKTNEYEWKDYEMEQMDNDEAKVLYELFKDAFYLVDSLEKENFQSEMANAYYESKNVSWYGLRLARNFLLEQSDWAMLSDANLDEVDKELWKKYRQALRDIPQDSIVVEANDVIFPISPEDWKQYYKEQVPDEEYLETKGQYLKLAGHHLANMKERIFQHTLIKQSIMNPLNYKNYRDKMAQLPPYQTPVPPQLTSMFSGETQNVEDQLNYLIDAIENPTQYQVEEIVDGSIEQPNGEQS